MSAPPEGWMRPLDPHRGISAEMQCGTAPRAARDLTGEPCSPVNPFFLDEGFWPGQTPGNPLWVRCQGVRGRPRPPFQSSPAAWGERRVTGRSPCGVRPRVYPSPVPRPGGGGTAPSAGGGTAHGSSPQREAVEGPGHVGLPRRLLATFGRSKVAPPSPPAAGISRVLRGLIRGQRPRPAPLARDHNAPCRRKEEK